MSLSSFSSLGQYVEVKAAASGGTAGAGADVISSTGLVYYYPFETADVSGATCTNKIAGGTADLTLVGSPTISTSIFQCGSASILTNANKYAVLTNNTNFYSTDASFAFWFRVISVPSTDGIFCLAEILNSSNTRVMMLQSQKTFDGTKYEYLLIQLPGFQEYISLSFKFSFNTWYHIALVKTGVTGGNLKVYINGSTTVGDVSNNYTTSATLTPNGPAKLYIGRDPLLVTQPNLHDTNGHFDDFRWYQRALSQSEVTTLYNNRL